MKDALKGYLALATGLSEVTRHKAVAAAKALVAQGEATAGQVTSLADDLVTQSRSNREAVAALVTYEVERALGLVGLASNDEVAELTSRVRALETSLRELTRTASTGPIRDGAATERAPATKSAAPNSAPANKAAAKTVVVTATAKKTATPKRTANPKKAATAKKPTPAAGTAVPGATDA